MKVNFWIIFGFVAQTCFFARFFLQWIASERKGESHIPIFFWYFSLIGGLGLFIYAIHIRDIVFILGQGLGIFFYIRNLMLIYRKRRSEKNQQT